MAYSKLLTFSLSKNKVNSKAQIWKATVTKYYCDSVILLVVPRIFFFSFRICFSWYYLENKFVFFSSREIILFVLLYPLLYLFTKNTTHRNIFTGLMSTLLHTQLCYTRKQNLNLLSFLVEPSQSIMYASKWYQPKPEKKIVAHMLWEHTWSWKAYSKLSNNSPCASWDLLPHATWNFKIQIWRRFLFCF